MMGATGIVTPSSRGWMPMIQFVFLFGCAICLETITALSLPKAPTIPTANGPGSRFVVLGGTGKIGTAVAAHLSHRLASSSQQQPLPECEIVLVGRKPSSGKNDGDDAYFQGALREIEELLALSSTDDGSKVDPSLLPRITYECVPDIWEPGALDEILLGKSRISGAEAAPVSCVIHTAGPYADRAGPVVLDACIDFKIPVYVDVSDPVDFLEDSLTRHDSAIASGTTAILAAGAFPGMSNVLAMEAAAAATRGTKSESEVPTVKDVRFNYFTKGLGGSGTINLYITNIGFGDPMIMHDKGKRTKFEDLSGRLLGKVDFFIDGDESESATETAAPWKESNARAKERVGTQKVFAWPFPEAATVASELSISRSSSSAMGTAPDLWNDMLGLLVDLVPRNWWRSKAFSKFLADFSEPLVLATDLAMRKLSPAAESGDCGETHAMRVDVVTETRDETTGEATETMVSIVQCHNSFRRCVGQSSAEFALDAWFEHLGGSSTSGSKTGVYLPEQRYRDDTDRERIVRKLTSTPGTFCYTGPVKVAPRPAQASNGAVENEIEVPLDRIVLKNTPTPGLICNGAPVEIRLGRRETSENNPSSSDTATRERVDRPTSKKQLPVYPTGIREIVRAMESRQQ